jgi:hypothetical protein
VQRTIEGSETACLLVTPQPLARSAGGVTLSLAGRATWANERLTGMDVAVRIVSPHRHVDGAVTVTASTSDNRR